YSGVLPNRPFGTRSFSRRRRHLVSFQANLHIDTVDQCAEGDFLCLEPGTTVGEAMRFMKDKGRGAVLVCRDQVVIGIFTERDALRLIAAGGNFDGPLADCMTPDPIVLRAGETVGKAISLMTRGGYRRLPIVDEQGRATGLLNVGHILHYLAEHFPTAIYNL